MASKSSSNPIDEPRFLTSLKPSYVPKSLPHLFTDLAEIQNVSQKLSVLDDYLRKHEEELIRVEEFRAELPQCMLLLMDAIKMLKDEISKLSDEHQSDACKGKECEDDELVQRSAFQKYKSSSPRFNPTPGGLKKDHTNVYDQVKMKFQRGESSSACENKGKEKTSNPTASFPYDLNVDANCSEEEQELQAQPPPQPQPQVQPLQPLPQLPYSPQPQLQLPLEPQPQPEQQPHAPFVVWRSNRRTWTVELHRRFMIAMYQLGGAEAATPKAIRSLMDVEGLTNDHVKSHLQKYRQSLKESQQAVANIGQRRTQYRSLWNPSTPYQANPQQQQWPLVAGARNGAGVGIGGGGSSGGDRGSEENAARNKRAKKTVG